MNANLSIFVHENEFHVNINDFSNIYIMKNSFDLADFCVYFLEDAIQKACISQISNIFIPHGSYTFTTARVLNSIAKGLAVTNEKIQIKHIDTFWSYIYILKNFISKCAIAISTKRGDFFVCFFVDNILFEKTIMTISAIEKLNIRLFFADDCVFNKINFALQQFIVLFDSNFIKKNKITFHDFNKNLYDHTPVYC